MHTAARKHSSLVVVTLALLTIIIWAGKWALADIYAYQGLSLLKDWQTSPPETVAETDEAMTWLNKARKLDTSNPDFMVYQARVFLWRSKLSNTQATKQEQKQHLDNAARLYRQALQQRPTWAFDWLGLLEVKSHLEEFDEEFALALKKSSELAPWEFSVQLKLVQIGFKYWDKLTSPEQDIIHQTFDRALFGIQFSPFFQLGKHYDQLELFCARSNNAEDYSDGVKLYACNQKN